MAEQTLKNPLTGAEIIEAVLDQLRVKMQRDCYLNANSAYDWFTADIIVNLDMHDAGTHIKGGPYVAKIEGGEQPSDVGEVKNVIEPLRIDAAPPNEVRVSTGQPVPTLTKDAQGRDVIKGVRYARGAAKKVAAVAIMLFAAAAAGAQAAKPVPAPEKAAVAPAAPEKAETLTTTEVVARNAIMAEQQRIQKEAEQIGQIGRQFVADIAKAHPGYHYDEAANSLVKDAPPKK